MITQEHVPDVSQFCDWWLPDGASREGRNRQYFTIFLSSGDGRREACKRQRPWRGQVKHSNVLFRLGPSVHTQCTLTSHCLRIIGVVPLSTQSEEKKSKSGRGEKPGWPHPGESWSTQTLTKSSVRITARTCSRGCAFMLSIPGWMGTWSSPGRQGILGGVVRSLLGPWPPAMWEMCTWTSLQAFSYHSSGFFTIPLHVQEVSSSIQPQCKKVSEKHQLTRIISISNNCCLISCTTLLLLRYCPSQIA